MRSPHDEPRPTSAGARAAGRAALARWLALAVLHAALLAAPAEAQSLRVLVHGSPLAGFAYDDAAIVFPQLRVGDALQLTREPDNPYDANAIRVEWHGRKLGYVPRDDNAELAAAMDRGEELGARISRLARHPNPRRRIEFDVFAEQLR